MKNNFSFFSNRCGWSIDFPLLLPIAASHSTKKENCSFTRVAETIRYVNNSYCVFVLCYKLHCSNDGGFISAIDSSSDYDANVFCARACNWTMAFSPKNASCVQLNSIELNNKGYFECLVRPIGAYRIRILWLLARYRKRSGATRITNGINVLILHSQKWQKHTPAKVRVGLNDAVVVSGHLFGCFRFVWHERRKSAHTISTWTNKA